MKNKYFDHILGTQIDSTTDAERKISKRILDAIIAEQPIEKIRENQRIGIKLQMESYLINDHIGPIIKTGEFLNKLLSVYEIKKSKFANFIEVENGNFHALLKGRRKFNSKIASILESIFNIDAELWLYVEAKNELKKYKLNTTVNFKKSKLHEIITTGNTR